jgi:hypothetical protein
MVNESMRREAIERTASMCAIIPIFLILEIASSDFAAAAAADACRFAKLNEAYRRREQRELHLKL